MRTLSSLDLVALRVFDDGGETVIPLGAVPVSVGRRPDNAVVLRSLWVSGHHCRVEPAATGHRIVDLGSRNGLLVDGCRVTAHALTDGDVVRIPDPTTAGVVTLAYVNQLAPRVAKAATVAVHLPLPTGTAVISIGRADAALVLDNPQVSAHHAQVERDGGHTVLRDLRSTNGTFLNGRRVAGAAPLAPGDVIQIGPFKLRYDGGSLDSYDLQGALRIDARDLRREVPAAGGGARVLLHDVSLSIDAREFVALVGGSGAGKSTLLMALSGYHPAQRGEVRVNGDDYYRNFDAYRAILGYVPQDDILHRMLPVDRALAYAARLKLPADTLDAEVSARVEHVLAAVEMSAHRDTLVEHLSGGQRKRVSIAAELLNDPSMLFLDEPTSGLDPGLEKKLMFTLRRLADSGRTVVLVTHATANIAQCDHVAFMAAGRLVYFGPPAEALGFFKVTSGDFADIYTKLDGAADPDGPLVRHDLRDEYDRWRSEHADAAAPPLHAELWQRKYQRSEQHHRYVVGRLARAPLGPAVDAADDTPARRAGRRHSPGRQLAILTRRYVDLLTSDRRALAMLLAQAPLLGALLALVSPADALAGPRADAAEARKLLFMLSTVGVWFGIINAAREVCKESTILRRERLADLRVGPYVLSKVAVLGALVLVQSALLLAVVALRCELPARGLVLGAGPDFYVTTVLSSFAGVALGLLISTLATTPDKAMSVVPLALVPQILFAGMIFDLEGATAVASWFTASRWSMDAFGALADLNALPAQDGLPSAAQAGAANANYEATAGPVLACWPAWA
jgi:ABC-type multidrug transport system ATPase subunit/pSer/pThr/pTyr-binding forkhead associated (FHA) protein